MDNHAFLYLTLTFLAAAVIIVPLFHRYRLGSVLGYLAAGSLLGPWGIAVISDAKNILSFSEFGVVLLLFVIGLELKPSRLWVMRRSIFGLGGGQLLATTAVFTGLGRLVGLSLPASVMAGLGLSLSSTAFALQILAERNQLTTAYGRASFAILLFQDLAVIPLMGLIPLLGGVRVAETDTFFLSFAKVTGVIALIVVGGRFLIRPLFRLVAAAKQREVFTGAALLLVLGTGLIMEKTGMSMALGTFLAGVLFADSEYRHELEADIEPFKGLLLGLFFMAVGMSVDFGLILSQPVRVFGLVVGFMSVKYVLLYLIGRFSKFGSDASRNMAVVLSQGGEFAFVLFGIAKQNGVLATADANLLIVAVSLSMAMTPLVFIVNEKFFCSGVKDEKKNFDAMPTDANPVIVAGFGRVGQIVARLLGIQEVGFTALEHDSEHVQVVRRFGRKIYYGDASRVDLLEAAGARKAKAFVLAIDDVDASVRTAEIVRENFPELKIFARARNRSHVFELMKLGVTVINRETFASSLELGREVLVELGTSPTEADEIVSKFRKYDEAYLLDQYKFHGDEARLIDHAKQAAEQLTDLFKKDKKE